MSRGISTQQQQILGAAVAISRIRNGKPVARTPQRHPRFRVPVVTGVWPDISTYTASHLVGRVCLCGRNCWLSRRETTPTALATRSSISRAITSLLKRGLLAYRPPNGDYEQFGGTWGYVLTTTGLSSGLPHKPDVPDLALRLWLMDDTYGKTRWTRRPIPPITQAYRQIGITEGCEAPRFLPAPGCAAVPDEFQSPHPPRYVRPATTHPVITPTLVHVDPAALAARIRALAGQNDPDGLRDGLAALTAELDAGPAL